MSNIDIILLDNSTNPQEEINIIKPKTYDELQEQLEEEFENLPENYELFILDKNNKEIRISNEDEYKKIEDILFIRELKELKESILEKSLYELNYNKLSESKQEILDQKYNCILCSMIIKKEKPYLCYKCQKIFHTKCLTDWDNECKSQNKDLICPNCRNELPLEDWNKKLDYEDDRMFISNLINKIIEKDNLISSKDKKIKELEDDDKKQKQLIKKYEEYIEKTFKIFQDVLNKLNSVHSLSKLENNIKMDDLIKKFPLNFENLEVEDISNVIIEEINQIENKIIKKEKENNIKNENMDNDIDDGNNKSEESFPNKSKTFIKPNEKNNKKNLVGELFNDKNDDIFGKFSLFNDDNKEINLLNQENNRIKSSNLLRPKNNENNININNNKSEEISINLISENNEDKKEQKEENKEIPMINLKEDNNIKEINIDNNKFFTNKQEINLSLKKSEPEIILSNNEEEYSSNNIPKKQKPLNRKIYSELIRKMYQITEKLKNDINIQESNKATSFDEILNKFLINFEEKIVNLKKCYIDTLVKRHLEKDENKKKEIILKANLPKRRNELKKVFRAMNETINDKLEKENQKYYYILILNILKKYENIEENEIDSALKILRKKKIIKKDKKNNNKNIKNYEKTDKKEANCNICFISILMTVFIPLFLAAYFFYIIFNNNII